VSLPASHTPLHWINIGFHVLSGSLALLFGLCALLTSKGGRLHRRSGRGFLYTYAVVIITATIGLVAFEFRSFLAVVTLLSFYDVFAGYRALQLRGARPQIPDNIASSLGFSSPWIFVLLMRRLHQPWSPILTWSILGGLIALSTYDLLRNALPAAWLKRVWIQEHLIKMIAAYIAISTAFAGTVFPQYMPWSAIVPSAAGWLVALAFLIAGPRAWSKSHPSKPVHRLAPQP
jgi:uncharacterized membrane protein